MRKLVTSVLCGLIALPTVSIGDDHGRPPPGYQYYVRYAPPPAYYRAPPGYYAGYRYYPYRPRYVSYGYPYYGNNHHNDNDDALWAIGGLIVGAAVATVIQQTSAPPPATTSIPAPSVASENCYDDIIHDPSGNPHVERHCYPVSLP